MLLSLLTIPAIIFLSGCQEKQASSETGKMSKLVAEENLHLTEELANSNKIILDQKNLLQKCEMEKTAREIETEEFLSILMQSIVDLRKENKALKAELEKIK